MQNVARRMSFEHHSSHDGSNASTTSGVGSAFQQQLRREASNATQQVIQHMSPKLFLIKKQQDQMKAELAASRQLHMRQQAVQAAEYMPTHPVQALTQDIAHLSLKGSETSLRHTISNAAAEYPLIHSLATQGSLTHAQLLGIKG